MFVLEAVRIINDNDLKDHGRQQAQIRQNSDLGILGDEELLAVGGRLILTGVNLRIKEQLDDTDTIREALGDEDVFLASDLLGESTLHAIQAAEEWLKALPVEDSPPA